MTRRTLSTWFVPIGLALALPLLALAWLIIPGLRPADALARRWQAELATLPADEIPVRLSQIADLGDAGLPHLAESLYSPREEVADAAREVLEAELARWQTLDARQSTPKATLLARELAGRGESADASGRRAAAEFATRILVWPVDRGVVDNARLIADCERVLRAAPRPGPAGGIVDSPPDLASAVQPTVIVRRAARQPSAAVATQAMADETPGDDLPASNAPVEAPCTAAAKSTSEPGTSVTPADESPPARLEPVQAKRLQPPKPLAELTDLELMRLLHSPDEAEEKGAARQLIRRGYTAIRLRVARRLTDPDPRVRRELAELLPQMSGLDARPWLLWLSRDDDPHVRHAAAAILATSTDPQLLARLREMRGQDSTSAPPER